MVYQCLYGNNAYYRVDELIRDFAIPWHGQELNKSALTTAAQALGDHQGNLNKFFEQRTARLTEDEFVSYDGTCFDNSAEVGWSQKGKTKHGNIGNQIHFSYLLGHKNKFPVMITTTEIINSKYLSKNNSILLLINNEYKPVEFGEIKYKNDEYDLSIINILEKKDYNINFLELDDYLYEDDNEIYLNKEPIYIMHYNNENDISVSYNIINNIIKSQLIFSYNISSNSYAFPIFNLTNNKLLVIFKSPL